MLFRSQKFTLPMINESQDFLAEVSGENLPCINVDCEFVSYQKLFFPKTNFFLLPAFNIDMECIICDKIKRKDVRMSQMKLLKNNKVVIIK